MATNPLRPVVAAWIGAIQRAMDTKKKQFQNDADEAMRFFSGPYDFLYKPHAIGGGPGAFASRLADSGLSFKMTHNRVAEMVQLFGPVLYHQNPTRQVRPRELPELELGALGDPTDPMVQQVFTAMVRQIDHDRSVDKLRASLIENYLNYTPRELDLKNHARMAIDEAIIKGLGVLWSEITHRPNSQFSLVGSFYDTVDNLCIDSDMQTIEQAKWCARRVIRPYWEVEREFGFPEGSLKRYANMESAAHQGASATDPNNNINRRQGQSNDLLVYWRVYSKMGAGHRIQGAGTTQNYLKSISSDLDSFGDYVYLAIAENIPFPLNLPDEALTNLPPDQIFLRAQWPIPFWMDGRWPFTPIQFHLVPGQVWPMSHLKPGLGELCFLNWAYSFLAGKVRTISKDYIAVLKSAGEEVKRVITEGTDLELIELENLNRNISEVVQFLQHPPINNSFLQVIAMVTDAFDKRVGLSELLYGIQPKQFRTATAAQSQYQSVRIRPDDMAARVEEAMSQLARSEAIAARWYIQAEDVEPVMGKVAATMWRVLVQSGDVSEVVHELEYSVEAGSAKRKWTDESNVVQALNNIGPMLTQLGQQTGDFSLLYTLIQDWAKANGLPAERYVPPPRQAMPPTPDQQAQMQAQQEAAMQQQAAQASQNQDLVHAEQGHQQSLQHKQEDHAAKLAVMIEAARVKNALARQMAGNGRGARKGA